jgi:hypothetical protein
MFNRVDLALIQREFKRSITGEKNLAKEYQEQLKELEKLLDPNLTEKSPANLEKIKSGIQQLQSIVQLQDQALKQADDNVKRLSQEKTNSQQSFNQTKQQLEQQVADLTKLVKQIKLTPQEEKLIQSFEALGTFKDFPLTADDRKKLMDNIVLFQKFTKSSNYPQLGDYLPQLIN